MLRMRTRLLAGLAGVVFLSACPKSVPKPSDRYAQSPQFGSCINALRMIDGAKQEWALEHHTTANSTPTLEDIRPYLGEGPRFEHVLNWLHCPSGGEYTIGRVSDPPTCSYGGSGHTLQ
jgi:hypothetical protein